MTREEVIEILERFVLGAKPCSQGEIVDACASAYGMLKEQPSLPSNLDEAAEEIRMPLSYGSLEVDCYGGSEPVYSQEQMRGMFKAGAEWMAGQGETIFDTIDVDGGERWLSENLLQGDYDCGEEVIVQIRKKQ